MKSSLKISVASIGLISAVLISAAASSAADKIAAVDYIVDNTQSGYEVEDALALSGQNEFFEQIEVGDGLGAEILNSYEVLKIEGDASLRPTENPKKEPVESKLPSKAPASSQGQSSTVPPSSQSGNSSSLTTSTPAPTVKPDADDIPPASSDEAGGEILTFKANGTVYKLPVKEALKKVVSNELDGNFNFEAIKAQVVATHTYIKYYNDSGAIPSVGMKSSYNVGGPIDRAVEEVYNIVMTYNNKAIYSPYFACSAGRTNASKDVWGGARAYLVSVESKYDYLADYYNLTKKTYTTTKIKSNYLATKTISADTVKTKIINTLNVTPSGDPSTWFRFLSEAEGGKTSGAYINKIVVAGKTTYGKTVRSMLGLRSADFDVSYANGSFTFTTRGYGHGVGLSQWGAHFYADKDGWDYRQILSHYYSGIAFAKVA